MKKHSLVTSTDLFATCQWSVEPIPVFKNADQKLFSECYICDRIIELDLKQTYKMEIK